MKITNPRGKTLELIDVRYKRGANKGKLYLGLSKHIEVKTLTDFFGEDVIAKILRSKLNIYLQQLHEDLLNENGVLDEVRFREYLLSSVVD